MRPQREGVVGHVGLDDDGVAQPLAQELDLRLQVRLVLLGDVVLGVLLEVAEVPRRQQALAHRAPALGLELLDLGLEGVQARGGDGVAFELRMGSCSHPGRCAQRYDRTPVPGQTNTEDSRGHAWRRLAAISRTYSSANGTCGSTGPPHELFKELRGGCPVHWTGKISEYPEEAGYWSVTTADDVHTVSRDWQTYSSERGGVTAVSDVFPIELTRAMFIGMDPPKHDRIKALFQAGFTPKRIAAHEDEIRAIAVDVLDRLEGRETCDLVTDVAQPVVVARDRQLHGHPARGRRDLGEPHELDARRGRPGPQPRGHRGRAWSATSPRSSSAAGR